MDALTYFTAKDRLFAMIGRKPGRKDIYCDNVKCSSCHNFFDTDQCIIEIEASDPARAISIMEATASKHLAQNNAQKYIEIFGEIPDTYQCPPHCSLNGRCNRPLDNCENCREWWLSDYIAPEEKK